MAQRNFVLTDLMKSGAHQTFEGYINFNTIQDQQWTMTGEYYTLHNYQLENFDRRFAIIDVRPQNNRLKANDEFSRELKRRVEILNKKGFVFIFATPWESKQNFTENQSEYFPLPDTKHYHWFGGVTWLWYYMAIKHFKTIKPAIHEAKKYDLLYLNKVPRPHRIELYNKMLNEKLLDNSLCSFVQHPTEPFDLNKDYEFPWLDKKHPYPSQGMDEEIYDKPYSATKLSLVSETNICDRPFLTEKIWKPILMKHPFIVHAGPNYLRTLHELGFKTFDGVIDETYDKVRNDSKRIEEIISSVKKAISMNDKELYDKTKDVREHNFKNFWSRLMLGRAIDGELLLWLKFFDSSKVTSTKS